MTRDVDKDEESAGLSQFFHISSKPLSELTEANTKLAAMNNKEPLAKLQPAKEMTQLCHTNHGD